MRARGWLKGSGALGAAAAAAQPPQQPAHLGRQAGAGHALRYAGHPSLVLPNASRRGDDGRGSLARRSAVRTALFWWP